MGLPCKYPNESSFIKWLNGPDKSPNEEINNSVIVTLLILIRPSCSALIPAKRRSFFTAFSSACQHCCRFFSILKALRLIVCCSTVVFETMKRLFVGHVERSRVMSHILSILCFTWHSRCTLSYKGVMVGHYGSNSGPEAEVLNCTRSMM